ncbi:hypothetical protein HFN89_04035 [Rhizobium laguerreae]|nr:hypothetical protein [Rhizobium laguerreae]
MFGAKDGDHLHLYWCLIEHPWEHDADLDAHLANGSLFGAVREKKVNGYYFANE